MSVLSYRLMHRPGEKNKIERYSVDFIIDGKSLLETLHSELGSKLDLMGCLVDGSLDANKNKLKILTGRKDPDTSTGRVMLYICPECGDIGCGALTVRIRKTGSHIIWEDFAREDGFHPASEIARVGPFRLDSAKYGSTLAEAIGI